MEKKTYGVNPLTWSFPIGSFLLLAIIVFSSIKFASQILTLGNWPTIFLLFICLVGLLLFLVYSTAMLFDVPTIHLELSDEGLVFYGAGYRIFTPWENIAILGWTRFSTTFPDFIQLKVPAVVALLSFEEGQLSRQAVTEKRSWWMPNRQLKHENQYTHYIRLPVLLFRRKDKRDGSIDRYLWYYLPHLMETKQ